MTKIGVAVVGATGMVGQRFMERLRDHPLLELRSLVASERRVGKPYGDEVPWRLDSALDPAQAAMVMESLDDLKARRDVRVVFSALPGGLAGPVETELAKAGFAVFSNAKDHRMDAEVPLLIPEVNPDHLTLLATQGAKPGNGAGFIVANGNCSGIILTMALAPLHRAFGLEEVHVTTLQGLSGAGYPGVSSMDVVDNVVPYIGGEEDKLETEPQRTLGALNGLGVRPANFPVFATATRVPVREGHLESVHVKLAIAADEAAVRAAWSDFRGPKEMTDLRSAPAVPVLIHDGADRPQPRRDRDAGDGMAVTVGRIRLHSDGKSLQFMVLGHNTVRGAAGQSVLNAEFAAAKGYL